MVNKIVIYGWAIPQDRVKGAGSGTLIDLVYFVDDSVSISDVIGIINHAGFKLIPKRLGNRRDAPVEADKVQIEEWRDYTAEVKVGSEKMPEKAPENQGENTHDRTV